MKRGAGILLPVFSLPTKYGIGTFGKEAYDFVDFLEETKQSYWQLLHRLLMNLQSFEQEYLLCLRNILP